MSEGLPQREDEDQVSKEKDYFEKPKMLKEVENFNDLYEFIANDFDTKKQQNDLISRVRRIKEMHTIIHNEEMSDGAKEKFQGMLDSYMAESFFGDYLDKVKELLEKGE